MQPAETDCRIREVYPVVFGNRPGVEHHRNHYQVSILQAAGSQEQALDYGKLAYLELMRKADSILESNYKKSFLERVPLSRKIVAAAADFDLK